MIRHPRRRTVERHLPQLSDPACERERRELIDLAESIVARVPAARLAFQAWFDAAQGLTDAACTTFSAEAALARLTAELRRLWLKIAHKAADQHMRSPHHADAPTTTSGTEVPYGYERELRPIALEKRCAAYAPPPAGWTAAHVLFSSAQGGLASILHWAQEDGFWAPARAPHLSLAGNYYETQDLLDLFCTRDLTWSKAKNIDFAKSDPRHTRVMVIEPVFYDEGVNVFDIAAFHRLWAEPNLETSNKEPSLIVLDTTLSGPMFPLPDFLARLRNGRPTIVIRVHSGLKLDQAGLELAGVGIVSIYCPDSNPAQAREIAERLHKVRAATGVGLTLDEISVLEVPWFLDARHFRRYAGAVFASNTTLANAISDKSGLFAQILHPYFASGNCQWAQAPYCALRLREASEENYDFLECVIASESERRGLLFDRGGSFGFRGHRYETVKPSRDRGEPFLRIAMGARGGPSFTGIVNLMTEIASAQNIAHLRVTYPLASLA